MNDTVFVGGLERLGDLARNRERLVQGQGATRDAIGKRWPVDEFKHECVHAARVFEPVDSRDIWMIQRGEDLCFPSETGKPIRIVRERFRQHLERHIAAQLHIARAIHFAHAARTNHGEHFVRAESITRREGHCLL